MLRYSLIYMHRVNINITISCFLLLLAFVYRYGYLLTSWEIYYRLPAYSLCGEQAAAVKRRNFVRRK